jgi:O-methyltransferase
MDGIDSIKYILDNNIEGSIVECGVEQGTYEDIIIKYLVEKNEVRDIYMYDTFDGLTKPTLHDYTCNTAYLYQMNNNQVVNEWNKKKKYNNKTSDWCSFPLEQLQNKLNRYNYKKEKLHYIVGDVMETLNNPNNIPDKIAILRLDTDFYDSTKFELHKLYNKVVENGLIIVDDYYHWNGQKLAVDEYLKYINKIVEIKSLPNKRTASFIKL